MIILAILGAISLICFGAFLAIVHFSSAPDPYDAGPAEQMPDQDAELLARLQAGWWC